MDSNAIAYAQHYGARSAARQLVAAGLDDEAEGLLRRVCRDENAASEVALMRSILEADARCGSIKGVILPRNAGRAA